MNAELVRKSQRQVEDKKKEDDRRVMENEHERKMFKLINEKIPKKKTEKEIEELLVDYMKNNLLHFRQLSVHTQRVLDEEEQKFKINEAA